MGLGSTAKKLQKVAEIADELYTKVNELKTQLQELRQTVEETEDRVDDMDRELAEQRALIEALAEAQDLDPDAVIAEAGLDEQEESEATAQTD